MIELHIWSNLFLSNLDSDLVLFFIITSSLEELNLDEILSKILLITFWSDSIKFDLNIIESQYEKENTHFKIPQKLKEAI